MAYGSSTIVSIIIFMAIMAVVAMIAERHPWRVDLTEEGGFTLSEQTRNILKSLEKPIEMKAFFQTASPEQTKAKDLLDTYHYYDKRITYEFIDPDRQPDIARRYEIRTYGTIVLEGYDKKQTVQSADEESITNAILKLSRNEEKKIYFLNGHGEHSVDSTERDGYSMARSALQKENYRVEALNLMQQEQVPKDAAAVVICGPQKELFPQEITSLKNYLASGGKLMVLVEPQQDGGLSDFLKSYGVELKNDIVIDKLSRIFGGSYLTPVVVQYGLHKITDSFGVATFYPEARSVTPSKEMPEGVQVEVLASTSPNAWAETNMKLLDQGQAGFDEKEDITGPVSLAAISEIDTAKVLPKPPENPSQDKNNPEGANGKKAYLIVAGDSNFADNTNFALSGNGDFFLNMVNFLAEEENLITIRPREKVGRPLIMTENQMRMLLWTVLVLVPLLVVLTGLGVYRMRRARR